MTDAKPDEDLSALAKGGRQNFFGFILRLVARMFFGQRDRKWDDMPDLGFKEILASGVLVIPIIFVGVYPAPLLDVIRPGVAAVLAGLGG